MKINYFTFKSGNSKSISIKKHFLAILMLFSFAYTYAQEDIIITTTSNDVNWVINFTNSGGAAFVLACFNQDCVQIFQGLEIIQVLILVRMWEMHR